MLEIVSLTLGPAQTNAYLVADPQSGEAVVIDLVLAQSPKNINTLILE